MLAMGRRGEVGSALFACGSPLRPLFFSFLFFSFPRYRRAALHQITRCPGRASRRYAELWGELGAKYGTDAVAEALGLSAGWAPEATPASAAPPPADAIMSKAAPPAARLEESTPMGPSSAPTRLEELPRFVAGVMGGDPATHLECTTQFRKLLSIERNPPIQQVHPAPPPPPRRSSTPPPPLAVAFDPAAAPLPGYSWRR